jgi:hypothetical protein
MNYFSDDQVQYYDVVTRSLKISQKQKANKFIEQGCIQDMGNGQFHIHPIKGYNKTMYTVNILKKDCDCQFATTQRKLGNEIYCSHIFAVIQYLRRKKNMEGIE